MKQIKGMEAEKSWNNWVKLRQEMVSGVNRAEHAGFGGRFKDEVIPFSICGIILQDTGQTVLKT